MTVKCNALLVGMFAACLVSAQASEVLQPRDLDGNPANGAEAYYDSVQDITWLADWRQGDAGGMTWAGSVAWAAALALGGYEDWRLPAVGLPRCQSFNCLNGELGFLWYVVLGNSAPHLTNRGPFTNMAAGAYWSGTSVDANESWAFSTFNGVQFEALTNQRYAVVAVRDGDTLQAPVPEPTTALLLMAGVATLGGVLRRRTRPAD
jgi:hypothetical protein